jgi:hypothetical protein
MLCANDLQPAFLFLYIHYSGFKLERFYEDRKEGELNKGFPQNFRLYSVFFVVVAGYL